MFFALLLALLAAGIFAPKPFGGIALLVVAALLTWFLFLTWPQLRLPERMMRLAVLVLALAVAVTRLV